MIMLALRDIDQEKVDYFQQGHTHLQTIHATLDPGKYSITLSYIGFAEDSGLRGCYTVMTGKYTVHQVTHCNTPDNLNHPQFLVYYTALMTVMNLIILFIYVLLLLLLLHLLFLLLPLLLLPLFLFLLLISPASPPPLPPPPHHCFLFHLSSCSWLSPCFDKTVLIFSKYYSLCNTYY